MKLTAILVEHYEETPYTFGLAQKANDILKQLIPKSVNKQEKQHENRQKEKSLSEINNEELKR